MTVVTLHMLASFPWISTLFIYLYVIFFIVIERVHFAIIGRMKDLSYTQLYVPRFQLRCK